MMKWLQKSLIIAVALLTFGVITPAHDIWSNFQEKSDSKHEEGPSNDSDYRIALAEPPIEIVESIEESFIDSAKTLAYEKFGTKIGPVISNEFDQVIFPKIDEAIRMTLNTETENRRLSISEKPGGNYSEKIFHVYDKESQKDLIRFHVRTDKRPQDGYFFNFHYHVAEDGFNSHYTIGDIYWSKNTPPKWLS
jgi:hypothetical protein